ncbi:hypothetical protein H632_c432p0 [Helicosporidium sp. ATCC 50920]|nr:hypothetical protein H632_c432p0 [Helicosporidium sp. ATCC 50920]|eukprot:KDD75928.1 hypothetical protein H632_c432p0 [Helicosporidium sp. ATCC 50920]
MEDPIALLGERADLKNPHDPEGLSGETRDEENLNESTPQKKAPQRAFESGFGPDPAEALTPSVLTPQGAPQRPLHESFSPALPGPMASTELDRPREQAIVPRRPLTVGLKTIGNEFMPYAAGFENMHLSAAVYRSVNLKAMDHSPNADDDWSYLYHLDSGRTTAASRAADPGTTREH